MAHNWASTGPHIGLPYIGITTGPVMALSLSLSLSLSLAACLSLIVFEVFPTLHQISYILWFDFRLTWSQSGYNSDVNMISTCVSSLRVTVVVTTSACCWHLLELMSKRMSKWQHTTTQYWQNIKTVKCSQSCHCREHVVWASEHHHPVQMYLHTTTWALP